MNVNNLLDQVSQIVKHYKKLDIISGNRFNVFKVIDVTVNEVRLHSRFIAELLNPEGSHGQRDIFLKLFLSQFEITHITNPSTVRVYVEHHIGEIKECGESSTGGRIDILIRDNNNKTIVIENKIYAGDQQDQLIRYYNFNSECIIYLTLNGGEASNDSAHDLKAGKDYKCVSYEHDIVKWLEMCQKESVNQPLLREGIAHYIELIKYLTNQTSNKHMREDIINAIIDSPEKIAVASEISRNFDGVKTKIQKMFWLKLIELMEEKKYEVVNKQDFINDIDNTIGAYYKKNKNHYCIKILVMTVGYKTIFWQCGIGREKIFVGFTVEVENREEYNDICNSVEFKDLRRMVEIVDPIYKQGISFPLMWKFVVPELNFKAFDQLIFDMTDNNKLSKMIEDTIACQADEEITKMKKLIREA